MYHVSYNGIFKLKLVIDLIDELSCDVIGSTKREKQITNTQVFSRLSTFDMGKFRGPCVRKLFTGLIKYLPSQNKEHCIVLYCIKENLLERVPFRQYNCQVWKCSVGNYTTCIHQNCKILQTFYLYGGGHKLSPTIQTSECKFLQLCRALSSLT